MRKRRKNVSKEASVGSSGHLSAIKSVAKKNEDESIKIKQENPKFKILDTIGDLWPRQTVMHGAVYGVKWGEEIPKKVGEEVDAAVGLNQAEALGALVSSEVVEDQGLGDSLRERYEHMFTGFTLDILDELDQKDGIYRFDQRLHQSTFHGVDGGILFDYVKEEEKHQQGTFIAEQMAAFADVGKHQAIGEIQQEGARGKYIDRFRNNARGEQVRKVKPEPLPSADKAPQRVTAYGAPRYFEPRDPVLLLSLQERSTMPLPEGFFHPKGLTTVRTKEDLEKFITPGARTSSFSSNRLWMPQEIDLLFDEFRLVGFFQRRSGGLHGYFHGSKIYKGLNQIFGSSRAHTPWQQAWLPLLVDVEFEFYPESEHWHLGEHDFERNPGHEMLYNESIEPITLRERLPVTKTAGKIVVSQIQKFLEHEIALDEEGKGELSEDEVEYFEDLIREFKNRDLFTLTLNGLDDAINSYASKVPTRAGLVKITQMELIDAYGQVRRIDPEGLTLEKDGELPQINVGLSVQNPADDPGLLVLRPRLPHPARLDFRLLANNDDSLSATSGDSQSDGLEAYSPICGFLLPDHIEWAMEVFDAQGEACGQLRVARRDWSLGGIQKGRLVWEPKPGEQGPTGGRPSSGNDHLDAVLNALMERGEVDEQEGELEDAGEGVLSALLRAIDTTYWHSDPYGKGGPSHAAFYMGRPVAVVRAVMRLQVEGGLPAMSEAQRKHAYQVRLGAIKRRVDGLLGYFLDNDYSRFHTVFPIDESGEPIPANDQSIDHEFLLFDSTVDVYPETDVHLTLLMNPQSALHITSGFLPQKQITLLREHWDVPVSKIAPTFKVGPVLVDPANIRMPIESANPVMDWEWLHRETPSDVFSSQIKPSDSLAGMPNGTMKAFEGWIKLRTKEGDES